MVWKYLVSHIGGYYLIKVGTLKLNCVQGMERPGEKGCPFSPSFYIPCTMLKIGQMLGYFYTPNPHV